MSVPEAAVEAAACDAFWSDDIDGKIPHTWTWKTLPEEARANYRQLVRPILEAALPVLKTQILREAALELMNVSEHPLRMPGIRFAVGFLAGAKK